MAVLAAREAHHAAIALLAHLGIRDRSPARASAAAPELPRRISALRAAAERIAPERTLGVGIDDIDDDAGVLRKFRRRLLADEEGWPDIGADQLLPVRSLDLANPHRKKGRGVVHQDVEPREGIE